MHIPYQKLAYEWNNSSVSEKLVMFSRTMGHSWTIDNMDNIWLRSLWSKLNAATKDAYRAAYESQFKEAKPDFRALLKASEVRVKSLLLVRAVAAKEDLVVSRAPGFDNVYNISNPSGQYAIVEVIEDKLQYLQGNLPSKLLAA